MLAMKISAVKGYSLSADDTTVSIDAQHVDALSAIAAKMIAGGGSVIRRSIILIFVVVAFCQSASFSTLAQERPQLVPRPGETAAEYESRIRGLPSPTTNEPPSVILDPDARGHYSAEVTVNGTQLKMLVDTGASAIVLSEKDAHQIGIRPASGEFNHRVSTANGIVVVAPVTLREVSVGDISFVDVPAVVVPDDKLQGSLLGMSFLSRLSTVEVHDGKLTLKR